MSDTVDVLNRAQAWLDEADRRGINMTDEDGYLAVIRDLAAAVRRLGALVPSNAIAWQERATLMEQEADRAWREVDAIAKERDDHHRWRKELADILGEVEKQRDALRALLTEARDMLQEFWGRAGYPTNAELSLADRIDAALRERP